MKITELLAIARPGNCAISAVGVFVGHTVAAKALALTPQLGIGMTAAFLITAAGNAINDYFDAQTDSKLGRQKISGESKTLVLASSALLFIAGIALSFTLNTQALAIAVGVCALLILYSWTMQGLKFLGNWVVALGTALTLVFGAAIAENVWPVSLLAAAALFANAAREIIKDTEDIEGDRGSKNTLPMFVSFMGIKKIIFVLYMTAISLGIIAYGVGMMKGYAYLGFIAASAGFFTKSYMQLHEKEFAKSQQASKRGMVAALLAFMAGAL